MRGWGGDIEVWDGHISRCEDGIKSVLLLFVGIDMSCTKDKVKKMYDGCGVRKISIVEMFQGEC